MDAKKTRKLYIILSVLFSLIVIFYVLSELDWKLVRATLSDLDWGWLALAFISYIVNYYFRARRFQILLSLENVPYWHVLSVVGLYGMYNYLLPAKSGEISLVILLKNRLNISLISGTTALVLARYLDFLTISMILPFFLLVYLNKLPDWIVIVSLLFCFLVILMSVFLFFLFRGSLFSELLSRPRYSRGNRLVAVLAEMLGAAREIYQRRILHHLLVNTIAIWISVYTNFYLIVVSLGYEITYLQIIVVSIFMIPMTLLPVQGLANLGTHEIGWVAAFSVFNLPATYALGVAVSSHVVLLFFVLMLGLLSFILSSLVQEKDQ